MMWDSELRPPIQILEQLLDNVRSPQRPITNSHPDFHEQDDQYDRALGLPLFTRCLGSIQYIRILSRRRGINA